MVRKYKVYVAVNGERGTAAFWEKRLKISVSAMHNRIKKGIVPFGSNPLLHNNVAGEAGGIYGTNRENIKKRRGSKKGQKYNKNNGENFFVYGDDAYAQKYAARQAVLREKNEAHRLFLAEKIKSLQVAA